MANPDTKRQHQAEQLILELFSTFQTVFRKDGIVNAAIKADIACVPMTVVHIIIFRHRLCSAFKYKAMENALTCSASAALLH